MKVEESAQAMAADGKTKVLNCISTIKVSSAPKSYIWSVHGSDHEADGIVRIVVGHS